MREWLEVVERRLAAAQLDGAAERDIAEELAQHLHDRYADLLARGVAPAAARERVLEELGHGDTFARRVRSVIHARPTPLAVGRATAGGFLRGVWSDVRFGARMLVRTPLYTLVAVLVMALGIGANTVIFIVVNSMLLQPLPGVAEPHGLAAIYTSDYSGPRLRSSSLPDVVSMREASDIFEDVAAYSLQTFSMTGDGWADRGMGEFVSSGYFRVLGVRPAAGRFFSPDEGDVGATASVAVISHDLWQRHYSGSAAALGSTIIVKGEPLTVIGVAPRGFGGSLRGLRAQLWLPLSVPRGLIGMDVSHRGNRGFIVHARLRDGVTIDAAQQALNVVASRLHGEFPELWTDVNEQSRVFTIVPESKASVPGAPRGAIVGFLGMLMAAVFLVLIIACTNVANLMLTRASTRRAEMGIRLALGATRGRIVRHLLAESVVLALLGGVAGLLFALWLTSLLSAVRLPGLHVTIDVALDLRVLAFATAVTFATGILVGLAPALQASRAPSPMLKEHGRGSARLRVRHALIAVQVAASLVLLTAGGLLLRSLQAAQRMDTGYSTDNVVIAQFALEMEGYGPEQAAAFYDELMQRVRAYPVTTSLTLARQVPLGGGWSRRSIGVPGYQPATGEDMEVPFNGVAPGWFGTMGLELVRGRDFSAADRAGAAPVVIVSEAFVRRFWPGEDGIGRLVALDGEAMPAAEVIGIARDAKYRTVTDEPQPYLYYPYLQRPATTMTLFVRAAGDPDVLADELRAEARSLAPSLPPPVVHTFRQHMALALLPQRVAAMLLAGLGLLAVAIAVIGLYGIVAFSVAQRTREFGIRIALGAVAGDMRRLVMLDTLRLVGAGIAIGIPVAVAVAFAMRTFLMVPPIDPVSFIGAPALLAACALLASHVPARRATTQDPAGALRAE